VYWLKRPIGWFVVGVFASLLLGIYVSPKAFLVALALATIIVVGLLWPTIIMLALSASVRWSEERCEEGDEVDATLSVTNRWPWPAWGLVLRGEQDVVRRSGGDGSPVAVSRVSGFMRSNFTWKMLASRRGVLPREKMYLTTSFPFGLWEAKKEIVVERSLRVWPMTVRLLDMPGYRGSQRSAVGSTCPQTGHEGDWTGVRPYRDGDSLRQVHWAQTARRDSMVVFERESCSHERVVLVLDPSVPEHFNTVEQREWMIRMLATLSKHFLAHGWQVQCQMGSGLVPLQTGRNGLAQWMDTLSEFRWADENQSAEVGESTSSQADGSKATLAMSSNKSTAYCGSRAGEWVIWISTVAAWNGRPKGADMAKSRKAQTVLFRVPSHSPMANQPLPIIVPPAMMLLPSDGDVASEIKQQWQSLCQSAMVG
jgi:uncharacterized protein (DUF58 family)